MKKVMKKVATKNKKNGVKPIPTNPADISTRFRLLIQKELKRITKKNYPNIYDRADSIGGYAEIEEKIIGICIHNNITPNAAIGLLESEFNV